jgi:hypothetical protein
MAGRKHALENPKAESLDFETISRGLVSFWLALGLKDAAPDTFYFVAFPSPSTVKTSFPSPSSRTVTELLKNG